MYFFKDVFDVEFNASCQWLPANQFLFQLANIFLVLTYFVNPTSMFGLLQLRFALMMSGICFGIWGGFIICALDCMVWNLAFALGNGAHLVYLFTKMRPLKFDSEHQCLYQEVFKPMGVKKYQYKLLMDISKRNAFKEGGFYAKSGMPLANQIGIILHGKFEVRLKNMVISHIDPLEFLDSPEWIGAHSETSYQVSVVALRSSVVYVWHRADLDNVFKQDFVIKNVFDSLIGKDICKKLFSVHKRLLMDDGLSPTSNLLNQAPLLTYSAVNIFDLHNQDPNSNNHHHHGNVFLSPYRPKDSVLNGVDDHKPEMTNIPLISVSNDVNENDVVYTFKVPETTWQEPANSSIDTASENESQLLISRETNI